MLFKRGCISGKARLRGLQDGGEMQPSPFATDRRGGLRIFTIETFAKPQVEARNVLMRLEYPQ